MGRFGGRTKSWEEFDDDFAYDPNQLDRDVVTRSGYGRPALGYERSGTTKRRNTPGPNRLLGCE